MFQAQFRKLLLIFSLGFAIAGKSSAQANVSRENTPPDSLQTLDSADVCADISADQTASGSEAPDQQTKPNPNPLTDPRDRIWYPGDTESAKPLVRKLLGNVLLDQKDIWTSPFHMHKKDAPWWLGFGAATAALIATDHKTSTILENSPGQVNWSNRVSTIGSSYTVLPVIFGFYAAGVLDENAKARETGILGTEALLDSMIVVGVLKEATRRNRPDAPHDPGEFFDGGTSFPSGHSIQVWSVASVISYEYGRTKVVPIIADTLAGIVSIARIGAQRHFASDVLAGGAMGWFIGHYVYKTHQDHAIHTHSRTAIVPEIEPASRTYGVRVQFER